MNAHRPVRSYHRGHVVELDDVAPTRTVLDWLREDCGLTGTKEGCNEGDCGACTVVVGALDAAGALALKPVNACIRFVPALDGQALFTVEDLGGEHPVQQALVEHHGSQCGFCTPGFVMSMWACWERHHGAGTRPTRQQLADDLAGNLCRCTGYRPILDAGERVFSSTPPVRLDAAPVEAALRTLAADAPLATRRGWQAPRTLAALAALRLNKPDARLVAGSTDIGLWVTKQLHRIPELVSVTEVAELKRIETAADGTLTIGAAVSLEDAWLALVQRWPALRDVWLRFASPPVRHAGTMGGNIANGSPIGDAAPVLMALDARLVLRRGDHERTLPLAGFYVDYMKNRLQAGEFVQAIVVPPGAAAVRAYKVSKRFDSDISALLGAFAIELDGATVRGARFAFGGLAAVVKRAAAAEAAVVGRHWDEAAVAAAQAALAGEFAPMTDLRASAAYRLQVAQNLIQRLWLQTRPHAPLPEAAVSVYARAPAAR